MKEKYCLLLIISCGAILFFTFLGAADLWNPDEPRDAEIAREMRSSHNYVVPTLNGEPFLEKPPLFYWAINAVSSRGVTETTARIPSALFSVLGMLLTFFLGKSIYNRATGFFAAMLLPCFFQYWWMGRRSSLDMTFSFFVTASLFFFYKSAFAENQKNRTLPFFYLCATLAVLTKGLLGLIMIGVVTISFLALQRNLKFILKAHLLYGALIFCALFFTWIYFLWKQGGNDLLHAFFVVNHLERFTGKFGGHNQPFYYYAQTLIADFLPWSIFLPFLISFIKNEPQSLTEEQKPKFHFILCWFFAMFTLLTLSKSKREIYLLPLYAPLAVLYAGTFTRIHERRIFSSLTIVRAFSYVSAIILVIAASVVIGAKIYLSENIGYALLFALPALAAWFIVKIVNSGSFLALVHFCMAIILLTFLSAPAFLFHDLNMFLSVKPAASAFRSHSKFYNLDPGKARIYMFNVPEGMQGSYLFYFKRTKPLVTEEEKMLALAKEKPFTCFLMKKEDYESREKTLLPYLFPLIVSESTGQRDAVFACNKKLQKIVLKNGHIKNE